MIAPTSSCLVVNGQAVPQAVIAAELQNHAAPKDNPTLAWQQAAQAVAIRTLLLQEAQSQGLKAEPCEIAPGQWETQDEALLRRLLEDAIIVEPPSDEAVRAYYQQHAAQFCSPSLWQASHILCACGPQDPEARQMALDKANQLLAKLRDQPREFEALARAHSDCSSKSAGGGLGQLRPGDTVPEFEAAMRRLGEGEISAKPVLTRFGWHIIRVDARASGKPLPFEAVKAQIAEAMEKAAWARRARAFTADLVTSATIEGVTFSAH